jgi:hypothetical protein
MESGAESRRMAVSPKISSCAPFARRNRRVSDIAFAAHRKYCYLRSVSAVSARHSLFPFSLFLFANRAEIAEIAER